MTVTSVLNLNSMLNSPNFGPTLILIAGVIYSPPSSKCHTHPLCHIIVSGVIAVELHESSIHLSKAQTSKSLNLHNCLYRKSFCRQSHWSRTLFQTLMEWLSSQKLLKRNYSWMWFWFSVLFNILSSARLHKLMCKCLAGCAVSHWREKMWLILLPITTENNILSHLDN